MREIKFNYIWERPSRYYGPYSPTDIKFKHTYMTLDELESGACEPPDTRYVKEVARRECTGRKDKEGTDIYEGDILKSLNGLYEIWWDSGHACFVQFSITIKERMLSYPGEWETRKVIGNIYENPELVEGK